MWSSTSQPWPRMQENTAGWNLLLVFAMSLLRTPSLSCKSFPHTFHCSHLALPSASWGAQCGCMLLGGPGSCLEKHRGKPEKFSTSGLSKKSSVFLLCLHFLHTCPDSPCHPSALLRGRFYSSYHSTSFCSLPSLPLQLHQPGPVKPSNSPEDAASAIWGVLLVLACNIFLVIHLDGWFWLLN